MNATSLAEDRGCVLVVDDDEGIREILVEILEERGCHAMAAANGEQAIAVLEDQSSDRRTCLILLDLMMPVMDGPTFRSEQLKRAALANIPVVVISAFQDAATVYGPAMNAAETLIKPLQIRDIMRVTKQFCGCETTPT